MHRQSIRIKTVRVIVCNKKSLDNVLCRHYQLIDTNSLSTLKEWATVLTIRCNINVTLVLRQMVKSALLELEEISKVKTFFLNDHPKEDYKNLHQQ